MKKAYIFWLTLFTLFLLEDIQAQILTILDKENNEVMAFASVISLSRNQYLLTDAEGRVDITILDGAPDIKINSLSYIEKVYSFEDLAALNFTVFLEPGHFNLDEIVVSATRWRESKNKVASQVAIINQRDIALQSPQTAADLLSISGKVFVQKSQQGGGSPMIRGFATNRLIYTVDGIRMNNAIFRGGNIQNVINLDPFTVEATEIVLGPESVYYGSDAVGGVMSFKTRTPQFSQEDNIPLVSTGVNMRHSTINNEWTGHLDINLGYKKISFLSAFSYWNYGDLKQGSNGPEDYIKDYFVTTMDGQDVVLNQEDPLLQIPSAYSQFNILNKVRFQASESWELNYALHYSETSSYGRYDRHNRLRNRLPRYAVWDYGPQKWLMNNLAIDHIASNSLFDNMRIRAAFQKFEESRITRDFGSDMEFSRLETVDAYSFNLDFTKEQGPKARINYGLEYVYNDVESNGSVRNIDSGESGDASDRYPQSQWQSIAAFVGEEYKLSSAVIFRAGLRYNYFILNSDFRQNLNYFPLPFSESNLKNGALTGSGGIVLRPDEKTVIKARFATAFRSPNVDDIGKIFDSEPGNVLVPNADLNAEYAYNFDFGIARIIGDRLKLDVSLYSSRLKNALVRRNFTLNGLDSIEYDGVLSRVQAIQNAANLWVQGLHAGIELKLPYDFTWSADVNLQRGEEELDDGENSPARHVVPMFGQSTLKYNKDRFALALEMSFQSERAHENMPLIELDKTEIYALDESGNVYAPGWWVLDFKFQYTLSEQINIVLGLDNLLDKRYRPYSSGISAGGRGAFLALNARFN